MSEAEINESPNQNDKLTLSFWLAFFCLVTFSPILNFFIELIIFKGGTWGFGLVLIPFMLPSFIAPIYISINLLLKKKFEHVLPVFGLAYNLLLLMAAFFSRQ